MDQDIAIDPEMLGNIYEILVNVREAKRYEHKDKIKAQLDKKLQWVKRGENKKQVWINARTVYHRV